MHNQKGFTLVELVVVIVILGILSAVAVPKFIDMQEDAKKSAVEGARGAVKSAVALAHARWMADGADPTDLDVDMEGTSITVDQYGYPTEDSIMDAAGIADDFDITDSSPFYITRKDKTVATSSNTTWYFTFTPATDASGPTVGPVTNATP